MATRHDGTRTMSNPGTRATNGASPISASPIQAASTGAAPIAASDGASPVLATYASASPIGRQEQQTMSATPISSNATNSASPIHTSGFHLWEIPDAARFVHPTDDTGSSLIAHQLRIAADAAEHQRFRQFAWAVLLADGSTYANVSARMDGYGTSTKTVEIEESEIFAHPGETIGRWIMTPDQARLLADQIMQCNGSSPITLSKPRTLAQWIDNEQCHRYGDDNVPDIAEHGAAQGLPGLTTHDEINAVYDMFRQEIWDLYNENKCGYAVHWHSHEEMTSCIVWEAVTAEANRLYRDAS